jgi:L-lactate dehydrogenase complex protein LldG
MAPRHNEGRGRDEGRHSVMNTSDARRHILRGIRENLAASARYDSHRSRHERTTLPILAEPAAPSRADADVNDVKGSLRFAERVSAVGGSCTIVRGEAEAAQALARIVADAGARIIAESGAPLVGRVLSRGAGQSRVLRAIDGMSLQELFDCDVGVTTAQYGIVETGTLILESAEEKHRLLSLVPPVHVALLPVSRLCESLSEAIDRVRVVDASGILASRAVTFITGPSRTSDIELTLTIGVHGPKALHVILLEEET